MATVKQKRVAKALVENLQAAEPLNKQELVRSAGYSELTADRMAKVVLESKGVQEELVSFGFNEYRAKEVVSEILVAGENDMVKLKAADMIFKVIGSYSPEKLEIKGELINNTDAEQAAAHAYAESLRKSKLSLD